MFPGLDTGLSAHQGLFLNSWHFFAVAVLAVICLRTIPVRYVRQAALLAFNLYFLSYFLYGWHPVLLLAGLLVGTYLIGLIKLKWGRNWPDAVVVSLVVLFWIFLFLVKDPDLLVPANPFHYWPVQLIGVSYLVFRSINYVVDVEILENRNFLTFVNFMVFFPTLLAGPIERYDRFEEFHSTFGYEEGPTVLPSLHRIANGLIKKFVLADNLMVFGIFMKPDQTELALPLVWLGVMLQLAVIYLDFSGYCDIVIGLAALMGFPVCENFDRPYLARNVQDFWNRWHMSLTGFIRDYVFTPLSRFVMEKADRRRQFAWITAVYFFCMLLIALWHDTTWGFFVFGLLHGAALVGLQLFRKYLSPAISRSSLGALRDEAAVAWIVRTLNYAFISITILFWYFGVRGSLEIIKAMVKL